MVKVQIVLISGNGVRKEGSTSNMLDVECDGGKTWASVIARLDGKVANEKWAPMYSLLERYEFRISNVGR